MNYAIIDTETIGIYQPYIYDFGMVIMNENGDILDSYNANISEIFNAPQLFNKAFYQWKRPLYGLYQVAIKSFHTVIDEVNNMLEKYDVAAVCAYNLAFDLKAINKTLDFLTIPSNFFKKEYKLIDIWNVACEVLFQTPDFVDFALANNWTSQADNIKTNAEIAYRWATKEYDFHEAHIAIDDCNIEAVVLSTCIALVTDIPIGINGAPWLKVADYRDWLATYRYLSNIA